MATIELNNIEEINIGSNSTSNTLNSIPTVSIPTNNTTTSSTTASDNFGGGLELLMNKGKKNTFESSDISDIKKELDDLTGTSVIPEKPRATTTPIELPSVSFTTGTKSPISLSSSAPVKVPEVDDSFLKMGKLPVGDPDVKHEPKMSHAEEMREKFKYLRKLNALRKKGVELSKEYTANSPLDEMKGEYELIVSEKERDVSVKFYSGVLLNCVQGLEFLNQEFDPFDMDLDGWSDTVESNIDTFDDVLGELHEKYHGKISVMPEIKLLLQLGSSAASIIVTNKMARQIPGMEEVMRQNPDLARQFANAAANTLQDTAPGLANFMSAGMAPPEPIKTRVDRSKRVELPLNKPDMTITRERDDIVDEPLRGEMKGPQNLDELLGGIKKKKTTSSKKKDKTSISLDI